MSIAATMRQEGRGIVEMLRTSFEQKDVNASGRLSRSIESKVTESDTSIRLVVDALGYVFEVEEGTPPPPEGPRATVASILRWMDDKRLPLFSGFRDRDAMAYVITRKINREGTKRHRTGIRSGAITDVINDARLSEIEEQIADAALMEALAEIDGIITTGRQ